MMGPARADGGDALLDLVVGLAESLLRGDVFVADLEHCNLALVRQSVTKFPPYGKAPNQGLSVASDARERVPCFNPVVPKGDLRHATGFLRISVRASQ